MSELVTYARSLFFVGLGFWLVADPLGNLTILAGT